MALFSVIIFCLYSELHGMSVGGAFKWRSPFLFLPTTLRKTWSTQFNDLISLWWCYVLYKQTICCDPAHKWITAMLSSSCFFFFLNFGQLSCVLHWSRWQLQHPLTYDLTPRIDELWLNHIFPSFMHSYVNWLLLQSFDLVCAHSSYQCHRWCQLSKFWFKQRCTG